jgi:hypothetical protein
MMQMEVVLFYLKNGYQIQNVRHILNIARH